MQNKKFALFLMFFSAYVVFLQASEPISISSLLSQNPTRQGLAVVVGDDAEELSTGLAETGTLLVHQLVNNSQVLAKIQQVFLDRGIYGLASGQEQRQWNTLPYSGEMANIMVIQDLPTLMKNGLSLKEIRRVLIPKASASFVSGTSGNVSLSQLKQMLQQEGLDPNEAQLSTSGTVTLQKAAAENTGEWTHHDIGPEGNALSPDQVVAPPTHLKWLSGNEAVPDKSGPWPGIRLVNGVMVYFHQFAVTNPTIIAARDAYNGTLLWSNDKVFPQKPGGRVDERTLTVDDNYIYMTESIKGPMLAIGLRDGQVKHRFEDVPFEGLAANNHLVVRPLVVDGKLLLFVGNKIVAKSNKTFETLWTATAPDGHLYLQGSASSESGHVYAIIGDVSKASRWPFVPYNFGIRALRLSDGKEVWTNTELKDKSFGQLVYYKGKLGAFGSHAIIGGGGFSRGQDNPTMAMLDARTGKTFWYSEYSKIPDLNPHEKAVNGLHMIMRDNEAIVMAGAKPTIYDINTGNWKIWQGQTTHIQLSEGTKFNDGGACVKSALTDKYMVVGFGIWVTRDYKYDFKELRRGSCAMQGYLGYGMQYFNPATCRCIKEYNDGKGFVAFGQSGSKMVVPDAWRFQAGKPGENYVRREGKSTVVNTTGLLRKTTASFMQRSPIVADWPESKDPVALRKASAGYTDNLSGVEFQFGGSRLVTEISLKGKPIRSLITGARAEVTPAVYNNTAFVGANDGNVYAVDLVTGETKWTFLAAPYENLVMVSSQLESSWPITDMKIEDKVLKIKAGRFVTLAGGEFEYGLNPDNGSILWKKRYFEPGYTSIPGNKRENYAIYESVDPGQAIAFGQELESQKNIHFSTNYDIQVRATGQNLDVDFGKGSLVKAEIRIVNIKGRTLMRDNGVYNQRLTLPLQKFPPGQYVFTVKAGQKVISKNFSVKPE